MQGPAGPCGCGCALDETTSYGFAVDEFARDVLRMPLDPWERWVAIHGGELLPDGRPRFRTLLVIVARQNGKSLLCTILTLFWLYVERWPLVLGTSTNLRYAQEPWEKAVQLATDPLLPLNAHTRTVRRANGEQRLVTEDGCRYEIAASNARGGRGLSIDRLVQDELREQQSWDAWNAAVPAMNARPNAQNWCISNQGDHRAAVLDSLRAGCIAFLETGYGDYRTGLFEWSAEPGHPIDSVEGLAQANPNVGRRLAWDDLLGPARRIIASGDLEAANGFRTEVRCEKVANLDAAVDPAAWARCADPGALVDVRERVALVVDVAPSGTHVSVVAAADIGGRYRVEPVQAWDGQDATARCRAELPALVARVKPAVFGWLPGGPAAALAADLRENRVAGWPPLGVRLEEIKADASSACMGFADLVRSGLIAHSEDPLLDSQVREATPLRTGDRWVFSRRGLGTVDALYAAAGAVHLARLMPPVPTNLRVIRSRRR